MFCDLFHSCMSVDFQGLGLKPQPTLPLELWSDCWLLLPKLAARLSLGLQSRPGMNGQVRLQRLADMICLLARENAGVAPSNHRISLAETFFRNKPSSNYPPACPVPERRFSALLSQELSRSNFRYHKFLPANQSVA